VEAIKVDLKTLHAGSIHVRKLSTCSTRWEFI
jgi:hypothetical protein